MLKRRGGRATSRLSEVEVKSGFRLPSLVILVFPHLRAVFSLPARWRLRLIRFLGMSRKNLAKATCCELAVLPRYREDYLISQEWTQHDLSAADHVFVRKVKTSIVRDEASSAAKLFGLDSSCLGSGFVRCNL